MQSVVTKVLKENHKKIKIWGREARCFISYRTRDAEGAQKMNQFANRTKIAAGILSTTYNIGVSSVPTTNQLVATDY